MVPVEHVEVIHRPVEDVLAYATDPERLKEWQPELIEAGWISRAPGEIGATGYQARRFMGRRIEAPFEVIECAPPTRFAFRVTSGPLRPVVRMSFEPQGESTRLAFAADLVGRGLFRLLEPLVGRQARKEDQATFARLKTNLEASGPKSMAADALSPRRSVRAMTPVSL